MARVEVKRNSMGGQCACGGHSAKYKVLIKGTYASPQKEILLCNYCFEDLKEAIEDF